MVFKPQRWMTRDFIFTAPPAFPDVTALQPERFHLRPHPRNSELPALVVAALDGSQPWDLDAGFAAIAADLIGSEDQTEWSLAPIQVLGHEGRYGTASLSSAKPDGATASKIGGSDVVNPATQREKADAAILVFHRVVAR
ncbi:MULTISPECIES: hypothetical protein [unclassified Rhizobium]|uniref:hypothetical protein n=1 Tax=unclassified Rhizobium TaxID=2613769 RepID=UPI00114457A6|nr:MULTISPECIES: hypothetical protein [unclassified Rhizobium]